ncbi:MAG: hypothetical protein WA869_13725, partial [Alloacidobacterium sp.]
LLKGLEQARGLLDEGTFLFTYGKEIIKVFERLLRSPLLDEELKLYYREKSASIRQRLRRA